MHAGVKYREATTIGTDFLKIVAPKRREISRPIWIMHMGEFLEFQTHT